MATTAGTPKRAWQRTQRPTFDDHSRQVWRMLLSIVGLLLIVIAAVAWWASLKAPSRTMLVSITDDREEFATVPPVPMIAQDQAALHSWARATKAPAANRKLSVLKSIGSFCDSLFTSREGFEFETFDPLGQPVLQRETFRKGDTLLLHIRAHGMALLTPDNPQPQPFLITSFKSMDDLPQSNAIPVAELLKTLATHEDVQIVVVLDAVHFNYDPRLGQLVNEFPTAVASAMPAKAKNLWVILPSSSGEISVVSPEHERTLFSLALLESWQTEKSDGAGKIALPDLVQLIKDRYQELREDEDDREFWQTAQLLPRVDTSSDNRSAQSGSEVYFTTIPPAKKSKEDEKPAPEASGNGADGKKTSAIFPTTFPSLNPGQATIAALYQPAGDPPANPSPTPSSTPAPTPAPAVTSAVPPGPAPVEPAPPPAAKPDAAPADDAPPRHRPFLVAYAKQLETAWRLRDELENWQQSSGLAGWSPVHFAPHHWRRLNAHLIAYEERCRAGTDPTTERQLTSDLDSIIGELERLKTLVQRNQPGAASDGDSFDLAKTWKAFRFGPLETPSPAWQSFQAADKNSLHDANRALKIYADAAYRLPEYVRLQGLMHSSPGVKLSLKVELTRLQDRLKVMRGRFRPRTEDWRIQPHLATELADQAKEVQAARDFLDQRIKNFAQGLSSNQSVALPGRGQAICLLLESPLLPAGERAELLDRVLPPLNPSAGAKTIRRVNGGRPGTGELIFGSLLEQSRAHEQAIRLLTGEETPKTVAKADGTLRGAAQFCLSELTRLHSQGDGSRSGTALAIGQQYRQFFSELPRLIKLQQDAVAAMQQRQRVREQFDLYHWLLLVDGRDAERLVGVPIYLTQPYLAETAPDAVRVSIEPKQIFLSDKPQRVEVYIQLISDKVNPAELRARLTLGDDAGGVLTIEDAITRSAAIRNRDVAVGSAKEWRGEFEVRATDGLNRPSVLLTASAEFGEATAQDDAECRMKLPNEIELKVVQLHRWTGEESIARAETDNKQGAELRLYPNRDTAFKLLLRNLSSDDKTVKVQLIAAPPTPRARLFNEKRELLPEFQALDRQIRSMREGLPSHLVGRVIAETGEKSPVVLKKDSQPMDVNLGLKRAANPAGAVAAAPNAAAEPDVEVTSGLICVITNVANPTDRFVRWLELRPFAPHELYKVGNYGFDGNQLSFQVRLMSEDFAEGMGLEEKELPVVWDRSDRRLGSPTSVTLSLQKGKLSTQFVGSISAGLRTVILPLHIDDYPRAMIVQLRLTDSGVLSELNLKQDTLAAVHIARLTHEKQMFLIHKPGSSFTPLTAPEDPADWLVQTLTRTSDQPTALIKLDKPPKQRLTFDLQADITAAAFARGASIEIGQEGQEARQLFHDRDIRVKLKSTEPGGVFKLTTTVDDYRNLPFVVDTDPEDDTRAGLLAAIRGSSELSSEGAIHSLPIIFDRKPPEVVKAALQMKRIVASTNKSLTPPLVIDGQITDGNGAGLASLKVSMATRPGGLQLNEGKPIEIENIKNPGEIFQIRRSIPDTWPQGTYELDISLEPRDLVGRVGEPVVLPLTIEIPAPLVKKNLRLGAEFNKEVGKGIDEAKAQKKLQDEIQKAKALQPPSGS